MKNVIERAVVLTRGEYIDASDLLLSQLKTAGDTENRPERRPGRGAGADVRWPTWNGSTFSPTLAHDRLE